VALAEKKIIYSEILVHSMKVSVQEYQKKMKMFQNNQSVNEPAIDYVNIYTNSVPRLSVFAGVTETTESQRVDNESWNGSV
jgi:hypothetical protein